MSQQETSMIWIKVYDYQLRDGWEMHLARYADWTVRCIMRKRTRDIWICLPDLDSLLCPTLAHVSSYVLKTNDDRYGKKTFDRFCVNPMDIYQYAFLYGCNKNVLCSDHVFINQDILEDVLKNKYFTEYDNVNCFIDFIKEGLLNV